MSDDIPAVVEALSVLILEILSVVNYVDMFFKREQLHAILTTIQNSFDRSKLINCPVYKLY